MAFTPLKFIYDEHFYNCLSENLKEILTTFNKEEFLKLIFNKEWENKELKERMRHTTNVLNVFLDANFETACKQIIKITEEADLSELRYGNLAFMFLPDYIEVYGIDYFDTSMQTLKEITHFASSEFAVRPFIIQNQKKALKLMLEWSKDDNFHIRRLASEGCRPKLPWSIALKTLQDDPTPILEILENLKNDNEDYVYRSVANNLNDISKDHSTLVLKLAKKWNGKSKNTDWLVKHGLRTLLKQGNLTAMEILGYGKAKDVVIDKIEIQNDNVSIGEYLIFSFSINNKVKAKNRLEYAIYFLRKNNEFSKKVFKISEKDYQANTIHLVEKKHSFKIISTRTYYEGKHKVSIIINGIEKEIKTFNLITGNE